MLDVAPCYLSPAGVVVVCFIFASPWLRKHSFWIEPAKFMAARGTVSNHNLLYNKLKAIPLLMTDVLNGVSGPRMNKRAHSNLGGSSGLGWNNICLLHQGLVHPLPGSLIFYKLRGIHFKEPARCLVFRLSACNFNCHSFCLGICVFCH